MSARGGEAALPDRPRILVVKLADMGDALLATPALRLLRAARPEAHICVLTSPGGAGAFAHCGLVDEVLVFEKGHWDRAWLAWRRPLAPLRLAARLRAQRFEAVLLLHGLVTRFGALKHAALVLSTGAPRRVGLHRTGLASWRSRFLNAGPRDPGYDGAHVATQMRAVAAALVGAGAQADWSLAFEPGHAARARARDLLDESEPSDGPLVAIHPGSGAFSPARRWSPEGFARVADALAEDGARIVLLGMPEDGVAQVRAAMTAPSLDLSGRTPLRVLAAVLERCALLVANDGGVGHLAAAVDTAVVSVFGPSNDAAWRPWWPPDRSVPSPHRVVALDLPCRPCFYVGHRLGSPQGCPTRDCLRWLRAARVLDAAREVLDPKLPPATSKRAGPSGPSPEPGPGDAAS
jgi:heptosyltransferase-2